MKHTHPLHPPALDLYDPPHSARKSPVPYRTSIGPTPQKDGKVLGLFDLLSPASSAGRTPSKQHRGSRHGVDSNILYTPSKRRSEEEEVGSGRFLGRKDLFKPTADASRHAPVSSLLTPTARRTIATPSKSITRSGRAVEPPSLDETPAFLRRHSQYGCTLPNSASREDGIDYDDQAIPWTPVKSRLKPKMAGKGLSALVRGLREMEEEKLDEELDILRELEDGGNARPARRSPKLPKLFDIPDSQIPDMPLGADGANLSGEEDGYMEPEKPGRGRAGKEGKSWKKKGQKRTTRQVTMRPVRGAWKPEPRWKAASESEEDAEKEGGEEEEGNISTIAETQITQNAVLPQDPALEDLDTEVGSDIDFEPATMKRREAGARRKGTGKSKGKSKDEGEKEEEVKGKTKRKINSTAHANFRALKIRNKNSKGQSGGGRRFGRR